MMAPGLWGVTIPALLVVRLCRHLAVASHGGRVTVVET